jgi:cytochrome c-type biogenesis protein CcmE
MTRKQQRTTFIVGGLAILGLATALVLYALEETMIFFHTPSDVAEKGHRGRHAIPLGRSG